MRNTGGVHFSGRLVKLQVQAQEISGSLRCVSNGLPDAAVSSPSTLSSVDLGALWTGVGKARVGFQLRVFETVDFAIRTTVSLLCCPPRPQYVTSGPLTYRLESVERSMNAQGLLIWEVCLREGLASLSSLAP